MLDVVGRCPASLNARAAEPARVCAWTSGATLRFWRENWRHIVLARARRCPVYIFYSIARARRAVGAQARTNPVQREGRGRGGRAIGAGPSPLVPRQGAHRVASVTAAAAASGRLLNYFVVSIQAFSGDVE